MKLRVVHQSSDTKAGGEYIIQKRVFLFWWKMATEITDGVFYDLEEAMNIARQYLNIPKKPSIYGTHAVN